MPAALATETPRPGWKSTPWVIGTWPMCSTPPIKYTSPMPVWMARTASCSACIDEPQRRFTVTAGTECGIPASKAALRATLKPCSNVCCTQPQITSSMSLGFSAGLRSKMPRITAADKASARTLRNMPALERPIGVRIQSTITAVFICHFSAMG